MMNPVPRHAAADHGPVPENGVRIPGHRADESRRREDAVPVIVASMLTTAGFKRSAMSANDVMAAPAAGVLAARVLTSRVSGADVAGVGVIVPATIRPTRMRRWRQGRW